MTSLYAIVTAALLAFVAAPVGASTITVTPNPLPLSSPFVVHGTGFTFPGAQIQYFWDAPDPLPIDAEPLNLFGLEIQPVRNDYTFDQPFEPLTARLDTRATVGLHRLSVRAAGLNLDASTIVTVVPRLGWAPSTPLPTTTSPTMSGGVLAYVHIAGSGELALVVTDGVATKTLLSTTAAGPGSFHPCARGNCGPPLQPRWSPDGSHLAFTATLETVPASNVYTVDRSGRVEQLTFRAGAPPAPSGAGTGTILGTIDPNGSYPPAFQVDLVGTGLGTQATPKPFPSTDFGFTLPNVPAGDYAVNVWAHTNVGLGVGYLNAAQAVHVDAGQTVPVSFKVTTEPDSAANVSWVNDDTLAFVGIGTSRIYSMVIGEAAEPYPQRTDWRCENDFDFVCTSDAMCGGNPGSCIPPPAYREVDASPATGRLAGDIELSTELVGIGRYFYPGIWAGAPADLAGVPGPSVATSEMAYQLLVYADVVEARYGSPVWDPLGSHLAVLYLHYSFNDLLQAPPYTTADLMWLDVAKGQSDVLTHYDLVHGEGVPGILAGWLSGRPAWSPDRSQIAFTYLNPAQGFRIRVVNVHDHSTFDLPTDGLPEGNNIHPAWTGIGTLADFPSTPQPFWPQAHGMATITTTTSTSTTSTSISTTTTKATTTTTSSSTTTTSLAGAVSVSAPAVCGVPGAQDIPVAIALTNAVPVRGIGFTLSDVPDRLELVPGATTCTARSAGFTCDAYAVGNAINAIIVSFGGTTIAAGTGAVVTLHLRDAATCTPPATSTLALTNIDVADVDDHPLPVAPEDGSFACGCGGTTTSTIASSSSTTATVATTTSTTTPPPPECVTNVDCDDGDDCTVDACAAGSCTHSALVGAERIDCELAKLLAPDLCAGETFDRKLTNTILQRVTRTRLLVRRALGEPTPRAKKRRKLTKAADRQLRALGHAIVTAAAKDRISSACEARLGPLVADRRRLLADAVP